MIVFEGLDATGKSTLARYVVRRIEYLTIQGSEGPAKSEDEIHERINHYSKLTSTIFDRHPVVSQGIYSLVHPRTILIRPGVIQSFYNQPNLFVYCDPGYDGPRAHQGKPGEDDELITAIRDRWWQLLNSYRTWAVHRAHAVYRIGDDMDIIVKLVSHCLDRL